MKILILKSFGIYSEIWKEGTTAEICLYKHHTHFKKIGNGSRSPDTLIICKDKKNTGWFIDRTIFINLLRDNSIKIIEEDS